MTETETGKVSQVRIEIPGWIYEGIVEATTPTILTYHKDYLLIKKPLMRFLYRICRLYDSKISGLANHYSFPISEIRARSGSRLSQKEFNRKLKACVTEVKQTGFFHWELEIEGQREKMKLIIRRKQELTI